MTGPKVGKYPPRLLRVYVAGPISYGNRLANVKAAMDVGRFLVSQGFAPLVPHLDYFMYPEADSLSWDTALEWDESWLLAADVVLVISEEYSPGTKREVAFAEKNHIPVVHGLHAFEEWCDRHMLLDYAIRRGD